MLKANKLILKNQTAKIFVVGAGFAGLAAACYLAKAGYDVTLFEKNAQFGGRARQLKRDGFVFDMGPTFYWMPDVFEAFFADFGKKPSDYYQLVKLNPAYQVYFGKDKSISIADDLSQIKQTFEAEEKGSAAQLQQFLNNAKDNYEVAIKDLVYQPAQSIFEIITRKTIAKLGLFVTTIKQQVARYIRNEHLQKILEFPVLFLGAKPSTTPAFYNFMNHADFQLGTWHPIGGMYQVVEGMLNLASELGVKLIANATVQEIKVEGKKVTGIKVNGEIYNCDLLLSGADYHHTETLLPPKARQYSEQYWDKKTFAPSALLFYVAFDSPIDKVSHHTLFFDTDFEAHAATIYDSKTLPENPLFYASFPSKTDPTCAPAGKELGIFLIPLAPGLQDDEAMRERFFQKILQRVEEKIGEKIANKILFSQSYCVSNFIADYNSYKGNAYGLANTLLQTHILRPKLKSKKLNNMYFTGQLTVPGPGVPPSLISGKIVSNLIKKHHENII